MKKITALLLALLMLVGALAGCGKQNDTNKTDKLSIVTTIFPEYDWVREILGDKADNAEVTMLLITALTCTAISPLPMTLSKSPTATCSSMWAASPTAGWTML